MKKCLLLATYLTNKLLNLCLQLLSPSLLCTAIFLVCLFFICGFQDNLETVLLNMLQVLFVLMMIVSHVDLEFV